MSAALRGLPGQVPVAWVTQELPKPGWDGGVFDSGVTVRFGGLLCCGRRDDKTQIIIKSLF